MTRKRGAPVLVELIKKYPGDAQGERGTSTIAPYPAQEIPRPPMSADAAGLADSAVWGAARRLVNRRDARWWLLGASALIVVGVAALWIGHAAGKKSGSQEWAMREANLPPPLDPVTEGNTPRSTNGVQAGPGEPGSALNQPVTPGSGQAPPGSAQSSPNAPQSPTFDAFETGKNYLLVATLPYEEAREVGEFLGGKGYGAKLIPRGKMDIGTAAAKNALCEVIILRGFASDEFKAREKERTDLMLRIKRVGRLWKAENRRAPSDFADALWKKY